MSSARLQFKLAALRRENELLCGIDMWGFVSIMLALLFLLMPSSPHNRQTSLPVDMAVAHHTTSLPGAEKEDAMLVAVSRDGALYFRTYRIPLEELPNAIRESVQNGAENMVYLKVDARAKYGDVNAVLDQIRLTGLERVSLLTESSAR